MKLTCFFLGLGCLILAGCSDRKAETPATAPRPVVENEANLELVSQRLCEAINQNRHKDTATFFNLREWRGRVLKDLAGTSEFGTSQVPLLEHFEKNPQLEVPQLLGFGTAFLETALLMIPAGQPWSDGSPSLEVLWRTSEAFPPVGGFLKYLGMREDPEDGVHPVFRWTKAGEMRVFELIPSAGWRKASVEDLKFCDAMDWADETTASDLARGVVILLEKKPQSALAGRWERDLYDSQDVGFLMVPFKRGFSWIPPSGFPNLRTIPSTVKSRPIFMINAATMDERRRSRWEEKQELPAHLQEISTTMAAAWQQASPDSPPVPLRTLRLWNAANQPVEWMDLARRMAVRGITDPMVEYAIIVGLLTAGRDAEAEARMEAAHPKFPDDPALLWLRFRWAVVAGDFAQAGQLWKRLEELKSGTAPFSEWLLEDPAFHRYLRSAEGRQLGATTDTRALTPGEEDEVTHWVQSVLNAVRSGPPDSLLPFVDLAVFRQGFFPPDKLLQADLFEAAPGLEEKLKSELVWITESLRPAYLHSAVMDRGRISVVIRRGTPGAPAYHGWLVDNMEWRLSARKPYKIQGICQAGYRPFDFGRIRGAAELGPPGMINFYPQGSTLRAFSQEVADLEKPVPAKIFPMVWPWFKDDQPDNEEGLANQGWEKSYSLICGRAQLAAFGGTATGDELEALLKPVIARTGDEAFADEARLILYIRKGRKTEAIALTSKMLQERTIQQPMMIRIFPLLAETQQWDMVVGLANLFLTPPEGYDPASLKLKLSQTASEIDDAISAESWTPFFRTDQGRALVLRLRELMADRPPPTPAAEIEAAPPR